MPFTTDTPTESEEVEEEKILTCVTCDQVEEDCDCCGTCLLSAANCECCERCGGVLWIGVDRIYRATGRYVTECDCCGECENTREECTCCSECGGTTDHYCSECDGYTCYGCECGQSGLLSYGSVPDDIEWRSSNAAIWTPCHRRYPTAPDKEPYLGLEIECEAIKADVSEITAIWTNSGLGWSSHDGSLSQGAECKTHPSTYEWLAQSNLANTLVSMGRVGARAWDHESCGLHIHISKSAFTNRAHQWRFAHLHVACFQHELMRLAARRGITHYCKFPHEASAGRSAMVVPHTHRYEQDRLGDRVYQQETPTKIIAGKQVKFDRSVAVNVNDYTIELRYWKGSLHPRHVLGAAAIEDALYQYSQNMTFDQVKAKPTWATFTLWTCDNLPQTQVDHIEQLCNARSVCFTRPTTMKVGN